RRRGHAIIIFSASLLRKCQQPSHSGVKRRLMADDQGGAMLTKIRLIVAAAMLGLAAVGSLITSIAAAAQKAESEFVFKPVYGYWTGMTPYRRPTVAIRPIRRPIVAIRPIRHQTPCLRRSTYPSFNGHANTGCF